MLTGPPISQLPGPFAAGTTPIMTAVIVDASGNPLGSSLLDTLTLSIVDVMTGDIVNGCDQSNILNTGRGTVDASGNLSIQLEAADTEFLNTPPAAGTRVQRALVIDWTYNAGALVGRHEADFFIVALAGP